MRHIRKRIGAIGLLVPILLAGGCLDGLYEIVTPNPVVRLPRDEAPHDYGSEWWYYTGRLTDAASRSYGVHAVVFHAPELPPLLLLSEGWAAHYAVIEESTGTFTYDQARWLAPWDPLPEPQKGFNLHTPLIRLHGSDGRDHLQAVMGNGRLALDLQLVDQRGVILHGADGYVDYGLKGRAFYYSRPQMQATGTLLVDGQPQPVTGTLWFDRQWGRDIKDPCIAWDWFSIRLDDGACVMMFVFRGDSAAGAASQPLAMGTYIPPAGDPITLTAGDCTITSMRTWTSPHTRNTYPVAWQIHIPSRQLQLDVDAVADDQELDARATTLNVYWEGLCMVGGTRAGQEVSGDAYVEMTNYPPTGDTCKAP